MARSPRLGGHNGVMQMTTTSTIGELDARSCYEALSARDRRFDGRFYTAVLSTGIFCRPVCPARTPKFGNCAFYPSAAAAAAAGFRPCLRCRPELAPGLAGFWGTANTVKRALELISDGALDGEKPGHDVESLADRLGVSGRHLRRLFEQHLGASPLAVAQTHRLLFAKKLLNETSLSIADVASASGYGSQRRFNTVVKQTWGKTPRELRLRPRSKGPRIRIGLSYEAPLDWAFLRDYFAARAVEGVERIEEDAYIRSFDVGGARGVLEVRPKTRHLEADIALDDVRPLARVVSRLRRLFDLDASIGRIEEQLSREPFMAERVRARPGIRVPGAWDGFELAVRAILGQQVKVEAGRKLASALAARFGAPLPEPMKREGIRCFFPTPRVLAAADVAQIGLPRARGRAVSALAANVAVEPGFLSERERLLSIPGVGEWTAQYVAMRALAEPDAFPATDVGLLRAAEASSSVELRARAEAWRPWRAYAAQHLWLAS